MPKSRYDEAFDVFVRWLSGAVIGDFVQGERASIFDLGVVGEMYR